MMFRVSVFSAAFALLLLLPACLPESGNRSDEERELHFLAGKTRVSAMDYQGAIESFLRALESNPRSAAAHFELGWLFERKQVDPAAAIYHYEQYLRLRAKAENADIVRQHILACKQELARTVSLGPVTEKQQRDLEAMVNENKRLLEENRVLGEEVAKWRALFASQTAPSNTRPGGAEAVPTRQDPGVRPVAVSGAGAAGTRTPSGSSAGTRPSSTRRTHIVRSGETLSAIARRYGVRLEALTAANPGINPRKLRPGMQLVIP